MGLYPDVEPCCPKFHRSTPKGPTARVLYFLRTQLPAYGLPEPVYGHNYYKLSLRERLKERPELQGLVDEVHDALRSYLLKITGIETASALIHLTAGVIQIISSSYALKKSAGFESALHITSIITGALSVISAIIQGIAIPPLVKQTFDKVTKAVSDTVEVLTNYEKAGDITPREKRRILEPIHLLASGTSTQGLGTTQSTSPTAPVVPSSSVPQLASVPQTSISPQPCSTNSSPSQTPPPVSTLVTTASIPAVTVPPPAPPVVPHFESTDNRVRTQVGVHHCTKKCTTVVTNSGPLTVKWYHPTSWVDTIALIFSSQHNHHIQAIAKAYPDEEALQTIGLTFYHVNTTAVSGCTRNAIFTHNDLLGLTNEFHHRPIAPGYTYDKGTITLEPWGLGAHNIHRATDGKIYWDVDMAYKYPFMPICFGSAKAVVSSLSQLRRISHSEASTRLNQAAWVDNHTLDKGALVTHPGPVFLTHQTANVWRVPKYPRTVVYPFTATPQSKQDWSKLVIGLITTTLCAVGVGLSPSKTDIMKWISGANQGAALIKNVSQAQDFIVNQLAGLETAADEELEKRYKDLCLEADNILAIPPGVFTTRLDLVDRYDSWTKAFDRFLRDARSSKSKVVNWYVRTLQSKQSKLSELWVSINQCYHSSKKRTPTVLIELTGLPGIGKTTATTKFIIPALAKMMGDVSPECFHWQINHNGHVNVYSGEIFSTYDEFRARGSADPMFQYLNHICSDPSFQIPSAFDKSRNYLSRVLFLTSNSGKTDLQDVVTAEAERAINSRIRTYRMEHIEAENLMKTLNTRDVICDRSPETFNYYRRSTAVDAAGHVVDTEVKIPYKDFLIDVYTLMWQQHNNHPPLAVDDSVRALLTNWTGVKEPVFSETHRAGRTVPLPNDTIPDLQPQVRATPLTFTPTASQSQAGVEHFIVNIRGHSGRGKTCFMSAIEHLFPRLAHTKIHKVDLKDRSTWRQAFAYWIDDQLIANQDEYLNFYNQLSQPSVIFLTSNLIVRDKHLSAREKVGSWWCGTPAARVVDQITVEGVKRRLGLRGVILLHDTDRETTFPSVGTFLEAEIERPGFVKVDGEVLSKDKFLIKLGDSIKRWREHELLYIWGSDEGVDMPTDPDICISAKSWASLKDMLTSGKTMWDNLTHTKGRKDTDYLFVKAELASKLKQKNEIVVDFWRLHPSVKEDEQDFAVESIFATYRQVDSDSTMLLSIGDSTYWNRDQHLFKRGRSKENALYRDDGDSLTIIFSANAEPTGEITIPKKEYVEAMCQGFIYSPTLLHLPVPRQDLLLLQSDYILGQSYMSAYMSQHLETIQVSWYSGIWIAAKKTLKKLWKSHPIFLVAGVLCALWVGWKGLTAVYNSVKTCVTGKTDWRCPACSYLHSFTREQRRCFLTSDYKYCPNCRTKYAITHEGELLSTHRLCQQTQAWQDETFNSMAQRDVKCPIAENQSPTDVPDNDPAWRSSKNGTVRSAVWKRRTKTNPNKYAPPLLDAGVPLTFSDKWEENWEAPVDDWEFQGKQDHYHAVIKTIKENMCKVSGLYQTKAMFIRGKYVIYPWHAHEDAGMTVFADGKSWDLLPVYGDPNADIAISKVVDKRFPPRRDITKYMLPASEIDKVSSGMIVIYDDHGYDSISGSLRFIQECHSHYFDSTNQKVSQNLLSLSSVSMATGGLHPEVGDCGNPYIVMNGRAQCLVGYHISYSHHTSTAYAAALIRENITDILADYESRTFQAGEKNVTSMRMPFGHYYATDDVTTYLNTIRPEEGNVILPENRCAPLGKGPRTIFPRKNNMYNKTPFSDHIAEKLPIEKIPVSANLKHIVDFSDIHKNRKDQYCVLTTQMASCTSEFKADISVLEQAEQLVTTMMQAHYGKDHRMLNQHEVLNGIDGISPVTLDTGAGIICERIHKVMLKKDAIAFKETYHFRDNEKGNALRSRFKHDVEMFKKGQPPVYLFKAELKSECLAIEKAKKGKMRLFNNAGTELILIERKMSGHIASSVCTKSGPIFIGKDPILHFNEYLKQLLFTHHLDIDVKRWDKSVLPAFIARSLRVLSKMHVDPTAETWYTTLFKIIGYPIVQFDETLAQLVGTIPSGMYHTALLGSVCHMIICTYALLKSLPDGTNPFHGGYFMTCADDLVYLHDGKDIDITKFTSAYKECGIEIQHPDKVGGTIQSLPITSPILFCSRIIRKEEGRWFPALTWTSLTNCLHFTKEKGDLGIENLLAVVRAESYALEKHEYDKINDILFDIYVFLKKRDIAASLVPYSVAHHICRNFISGLIESRTDMLTGYSSGQAVNKILSIDLGAPQGKPKTTVRIDKVPLKQRDIRHTGRMGTEHPRTRFLQSGDRSLRSFEEHITASPNGFTCTLTVAGKSYHGNGSSYATAGRTAWDRYEDARPAASNKVSEENVEIPASNLHPKTRCNTIFQKAGHSRPTIYSFATKTGWTSNLEQDGNTIVRSGKDKKSSEFLVWDIYYCSLCKKLGYRTELEQYLSYGFSRVKPTTVSTPPDPTCSSSTPQADANSDGNAPGPWSPGSFRTKFLNSALYGASLADLERSFLSYVMSHYQPGHLPTFEIQKLRVASKMTSRRNFPIASEEEIIILSNMCVTKCQLELQLWAKLASEMTDESVKHLFNTHYTHSTPQGDNQYDMPPVPSSYLPIATTRGVTAPMAVPAMGVPTSMLSYGGVASDVVDIMNREIWSPCVPISPSDPAGTVLLNISWADITNWGITQFLALHKKAAGEVYVTLLISGANQCTGLLRAGLVMENNTSPTLSDLECAQNITLGLNGDQTMTFPLKYVSDSKFYMDTENLPDFPRVVVIQESSISNMYGSTAPAAQMKYAFDAASREMSPEGKYVKNNLGLSIVVADCRPPSSTSSSSISSTGIAMRDIFAGENFLNLCTDGRTSYNFNSCDMTKRPVLPGTLDQHVSDVDITGIPFLQNYYDGTLIVSSNIGTNPNLRDCIFVKNGKDAQVEKTGTGWDSIFLKHGQYGHYLGAVHTTDGWGFSLTGMKTILDSGTLQALADVHELWYECSEQIGGDTRQFKTTATLFGHGYDDSANRINFSSPVPVTIRHIYLNGCAYYTYQIDSSDFNSLPEAIEAKFLLPFQGDTVTIPCDTDGQLSTTATTTSILHNAAILGINFGENLPIAVSSEITGAISLPPTYAVARFLDTVPALVQTPNGQSFQPAVSAEHKLKQWLIQHTNAREGDILHFNLGRRGFAESVADIRMMVMATAAESYLVLKGSQQYSWFGNVLDTQIRGLIKTNAAALLPTTDQTGWVSMLTNGQLQQKFKRAKQVSPESLATLLAADPEFRSIARRYTSTPQSGLTRRELAETMLGNFVSPRRNQWKRRAETILKYEHYKKIQDEDQRLIDEMREVKADVELSARAQELYRMMQAHLVARRDTDHDPMMLNDAWKTSINDSVSSVNMQLARINKNLEKLHDLLSLSNSLAKPIVRDVINQAGLVDNKEVAVQCSIEKRFTSTPQAEVAALAFSGFAQGVGGGISKYYDRKFQKQMLAQSWQNASEMQKMKGKQALQQELLQGGLSYRTSQALQQKNFQNQLELTGMQGASRLAMTRQQGANQLNVEKYKKTGSTETPQPTAEAGTTMHHDIGVGTAPKKQAPQPPTTSTGSGPDELEQNYDYLTSKGMMKDSASPAAAPTAAASVSLASTSSDGLEVEA